LHRAIAKRRIRADGRAWSQERDREPGSARSSGRRGSSDATREGRPSGNRSCSSIGRGGVPSHARPIAWSTPATFPSRGDGRRPARRHRRRSGVLAAEAGRPGIGAAKRDGSLCRRSRYTRQPSARWLLDSAR
jgi:hypothetical protein